MDAETEKPFDVDGKAVTAETSFTPEEANGSVELPLPLMPLHFRKNARGI